MGERLSGGIAHFKNLTPADKRKMLLKRSSEHNKKTGIAEKRVNIDQQFKREARETFGFSKNTLKS